MSGPNQTPASRRFLTSQHTSSSTSTRRSQFLRTPQQTTSSPYPATPSLRGSSKANDDIETLNEDEENDRTLTTNIVRSKSASRPNDDGIEDDFESYEDTLAVTSRPTPYRTPVSNPTNINNDAIFDEAEQFSSPLPKRQKLSHQSELGNVIREAELSSSPSARAMMTRGEQDAMHAQHLNDDQIEEPTSLSSRFVTSVPTKAIFPDSLPKPSFKAFLHHAAAGEDPRLDVALPDAFSPSRRRGKRDYIHGGLADAIRSSVLEIANVQTQGGLQQGTIINMKHHLSDESGRFEIAVDETAKRWMLVRQSDHTSRSALIDSANGTGYVKILIKGSATTWTVELADDSSLEVAILWEVVK